MVRIAVIGAGVAGLSSAVNIQQEVLGADVTIIADKFGADTTSDGAGGFFRPYMPDYIYPGIDQKLVEQWLTDSYEFYHGLARSPLAGETGQSLVSGILVFNEPQDEGYSFLKRTAPDFRKVSQEELNNLHLGKYKYGYAYTTVVSQNRYLGWLMNKFRASGGKVVDKTVKSLKELAASFDIVVNCCGLRGFELVQDDKCFPIKGHLVLLHAPWQKHFLFTGDGTYLVPHDGKLIVGGLKDKGNSSTHIDPEVRERILSKALTLAPQLKGARIIGEWVALRPGREGGVRLELEFLECGQNKKLPVVHNYGHGGHGITLGWGCGKHATRLVQEAVRGLKPRL